MRVTGEVVHFEIPADDVERAKRFYKDAFGWNISAYPGMDYHMVGTGPSDERGMPKNMGVINGGMMKRQEPVKSTVVTIRVDDLDAATKKVEKLGGKVVRKKAPVGDMGFTAYFKDSEGNIVGLWQDSKK
jgi:predicted enzyme related to lactoylglutathione lyase